METVQLIGLDFGTTTSSAVIATAQLLCNAITGRVELSHLKECFRSDIAFTPTIGDQLDLRQLSELIDSWLAHSSSESLFGGGALLTGLTAQQGNAYALIQLIRQRVNDAVVACADDPRLESWLAFMGGCAGLSRQHLRIAFVNLDIGGGTTNLALGINGEVLSTGCLFIGARHVQVVPGTYRIVALSRYATRLLEHLDIHKTTGDELSPNDVERILDQYISWLVQALAGRSDFNEPVAALHQQAAFCPHFPSDVERVVVTLSGGVGALVYDAVQGISLPDTTAYGDLGIDFARRLLGSPWATDFHSFMPSSAGRATSYGLLRHTTQVSGSTLFISDPALLPLRDVPILGTIDGALPEPQWGTILDLVRASAHGACVQIALPRPTSASIRALGMQIGESLRQRAVPTDRPLIIIIPGNVGKTLGHYITKWGAAARALIVIDEIGVTDARFVHIGRPRDGVVPVSYYGLQP